MLGYKMITIVNDDTVYNGPCSISGHCCLSHKDTGE